ncbi:MAG: enoyl-CoA hydratase/isomerase family protein [Terrimonas sp.]|nr:enoyl-CoA hydratase/isomerase family protein [Terrimonas sp.]
MEKIIEGGYVKSEFHNGITSIEFFHPQRNSLPGKILDEMAQTIHRAGNDEYTRVIILRSAGDHAFCAGASFDELLAIKNEEEGLHFFSGFAHVINAMRTAPKFVIARIQGRCVGGGVGIAAAADYAIAMDTAEIKLSELAVGIGPFVVGPAVERKIGVSAFSQLAMDATLWRSADWAQKRGLYAEVYSQTDHLDESVRRMTDTLLHSNPAAMAAMKKIFWKGTENWDQLLIERAKISGKLVLSEFTREAILKFKKK